MSVRLGIDTGGTYTDAVLFDDEKGVVGSAKALTTKHDLSIGIREAMEAVLPATSRDVLRHVRLVSLSTTLATNAVVEGQGCPVCLVLIGYDPELMQDIEIGKIVPSGSIVYLRGGHTSTGLEQEPLDMASAREAVMNHAGQVDAFAVSGYFGVRNPEHELEVRKLIRDLTGRPVTCGHELTTRLHAPRRALTVAMNARLIPLLEELVLTVRGILTQQEIDVPLMVVKGDGSLVDARMALERPVETILSGPAASVVGASHLADRGDAFVIDMGGTTTDIAAMRDGRPVLNPEGARIDGWQIMIEAIDARTTGLGGDSDIRLNDRGGLFAGPQRVVPLCLLADQYPQVLDTLRLQKDAYGDGERDSEDGALGRFVLRQRQLPQGDRTLSSTQQEIWERLKNGPVPLVRLMEGAKYPPIFRRSLEDLTARGVVVAGGFTPTDAVHVLGQYRCWSVEAAELGADLWARQLNTSAEQFCEAVVGQVEFQLGRAIIHSALAEERHIPREDRDDLGSLFVDRALGAGDAGTFAVDFRLCRALVAIGAPVPSYLPAVAERLNADLVIPEHPGVDNALGAAVAGIVQTVRVLIQSLDEGRIFKVHLPYAVKEFRQLEKAVGWAQEEAGRSARENAMRAGAEDVHVDLERHDRIVKGGDGLVEEIYIDTEVIATAVGRPRLAANAA